MLHSLWSFIKSGARIFLKSKRVLLLFLASNNCLSRGVEMYVAEEEVQKKKSETTDSEETNCYGIAFVEQ